MPPARSSALSTAVPNSPRLDVEHGGAQLHDVCSAGAAARHLQRLRQCDGRRLGRGSRDFFLEEAPRRPQCDQDLWQQSNQDMWQIGIISRLCALASFEESSDFAPTQLLAAGSSAPASPMHLALVVQLTSWHSRFCHLRVSSVCSHRLDLRSHGSGIPWAPCHALPHTERQLHR